VAAAAVTTDNTVQGLTIPAEIGPQALIDAAKQSDPLAFFEIGRRIANGNGVTADENAARAWYEKSAAMGFAPASYMLGNLYEKGIGVSRDIPKATEYYLSAAKAGNISAMHNLAVLYATGNGGAPDFGSAAHWFEEAANHGVRDSQFNLAILYAKGSGVKQDLVQSYKWFGIAAKDGDQDAAQKRDDVGKVLEPAQVESAKSAVADWKMSVPDDKANSTQIPDAWGGKALKTSGIDMKKAIRNIQAILNKNGFDAGTPDGVMGEKTVTAIKQFQTSAGQNPTGEIDEALVRELLARNK
jgi:localization factor PodJL